MYSKTFSEKETDILDNLKNQLIKSSHKYRYENILDQLHKGSLKKKNTQSLFERRSQLPWYLFIQMCHPDDKSIYDVKRIKKFVICY